MAAEVSSVVVTAEMMRVASAVAKSGSLVSWPGNGGLTAWLSILRRPCHRPHGEGKAGPDTGRAAPAMATGDGNLCRCPPAALACRVRCGDPGAVRPEARAAHAATHHDSGVIGCGADHAGDHRRSAPHPM